MDSRDGPTLGGYPGRGRKQTISGDNSNRHRPPRKGTKIHSVLAALASGRSLNRFEAERDLRDHCIHSTVAEIQGRLGIRVERRMETVPCFHGTKKAEVARYWLSPDQQQKARQLLGIDRGVAV